MFWQLICLQFLKLEGLYSCLVFCVGGFPEGFYTAARVQKVQEPLTIQAVVVKAAMEAFRIRVFPGAPRLCVHTGDIGFLQPSSHRLGRELRPVVAAIAFRNSVLVLPAVQRLLAYLVGAADLSRALSPSLSPRIFIICSALWRFYFISLDIALPD